jgi:hypothetical protein
MGPTCTQGGVAARRPWSGDAGYAVADDSSNFVGERTYSVAGSNRRRTKLLPAHHRAIASGRGFVSTAGGIWVRNRPATKSIFPHPVL